MELERLVVVWCPELQQEGPRGEEARRFVQVVARAGELCPWAHPIRLGVCALPARGPARFFGGEEMVVSRLVEVVGEDAHVGVADGLFAAVLAARARLIVPAGEARQFLAPWSVATLARPELAVTLQRLGVTTLGQFAALPSPHVSDRFGADAAAAHLVARGESGELAGFRDRSIERRLRVARGEDPDLGSAPPPYQPGFFGGASAADTRAALSFARVQERLGIEAVLVGRVQGGRDPAEQAALVPWGSPEAGAAPTGGAPWPGRLPAPSPTAGAPGAPAGRGGRRRRTGVGGERAGPPQRRAGPALGRGWPVASRDGVGRPVAGDRAVVVGTAAPGPGPGGDGRRGGPAALRRTGAVVGRGAL